MSVKIKVPAVFRRYTGDKSTIYASPGSIKSILDEITGVFPGLRSRLMGEDHKLKTHVNILINNRLISKKDIDIPVTENDTLTIIIAVMGG